MMEQDKYFGDLLHILYIKDTLKLFLNLWIGLWCSMAIKLDRSLIMWLGCKFYDRHILHSIVRNMHTLSALYSEFIIPIYGEVTWYREPQTASILNPSRCHGKKIMHHELSAGATNCTYKLPLELISYKCPRWYPRFPK